MELRSARRNRVPYFFVILLCLAITPPANARRSRGRVHLIPHFAEGQSFTYRIHLRSNTSASAAGPIADPEGPTKSAQNVTVLLRLEVLSVSQAPAAPGAARIRATYESADADTNSDSYDPGAAETEKQFRALAGHSIEFTLDPAGKVTAVTGLAQILPDPSKAATVQQWLGQLTLGASLPKRGIAVGQKWTSKQPVENAPLSGLAWRSQSTYLRNEPCAPTANRVATAPRAGSAVSPSGECAVILIRSEIIHSGGGKDRTPSDYRQNGLRTSGEWTGQSECLTSISLRTGMVSSVTQTGSTHTDFTVTSVTSGNHIHYKGQTQSQAEITLVSQSATP